MLLAEPHDFGRRVDALCTSTETLYNLPKLKASEYWGYPKHGQYSQSRVAQAERHLDASIHIPLDLCNFWNCVFLELGGKHPNVSTGMAAVIIALDRWRPETLFLAGFDNVVNPKIEGYACTVPTPWNDGGRKDTGHDWATEHKLLYFLATHFRASIEDLNDSGHKFLPGGL